MHTSCTVTLLLPSQITEVIIRDAIWRCSCKTIKAFDPGFSFMGLMTVDV